MNPILKTTIIAASPLAASLSDAAPAATFEHITPLHNSAVRSPRVLLTGRVSHDVYPAGLVRASINGRPLPLSPDGGFRHEIKLLPGINQIRLRALSPNPRQQTTVISSFIDGSMIYGSDDTRARALRSFEGGRLKTSGDNLPTLNRDGLENANASPFPDEELFLAGDVRANENLELTAIHALFVREHNQIAAAIAAAYPDKDDERIYQEARRIVAAELQVITYREFLPALLGPGALRPYRGYHPSVNPGIANEFSTAAFRIGHTMINDDVEFMDNEGAEIREGLALAEAFFNPAPIKETGPDPLLKYLASDNAQEIDNQLVDGLRDFLFGPPGSGGLDLASLNIQRGRDHGLGGYNTVRKAYGLPPVKSFDQLTRNPDLQAKLSALYGNPDSIDLWVAGLAEDHLPGSSVGPTFHRIIADQFERTRDGDSNWHERTFHGKQLAALRATRLSDIIRRNTTITKIQDNVFFFDPVKTLAGLTPRTGVLPPDLVRGPAMDIPPARFDGSGNHATHPSWGAAGSALLRRSPACYADGVSLPSGADRPGARLVSNTVAALTTEEPNARLMSSWIYGWGQFIDHDLSLTHTGSESFNITVPAGDPSFDPFGSGLAVIPMSRSEFDPSTATAKPSVTEKIHHISLKESGGKNPQHGKTRR